MVGFADPSGLSTHPGWPLRNFLALLKKWKGIESITVVCYRESISKGAADISHSIVIEVKMPGILAGAYHSLAKCFPIIKCVGVWY